MNLLWCKRVPGQHEGLSQLDSWIPGDPNPSKILRVETMLVLFITVHSASLCLYPGASIIYGMGSTQSGLGTVEIAKRAEILATCRNPGLILDTIWLPVPHQECSQSTVPGYSP